MPAKRQPDHHCPVCHKHSKCHLYEGMPLCPVPHDIQCGSCGLKLERLLRAQLQVQLLVIGLSEAALAAKAAKKLKRGNKKKKVKV